MGLSISTIINDAKTLIGIAPEVVDAVKAVEAAAVGTTQTGADKAAAVTNIVLAALQTTVPAIFNSLGLEKLTGFIGKAINEVVTLFNKIGIFEKSAASAPPPAGS
ncbi:MAG: hypothetical protein ACREDR_46380 [Blastocatellia bacterium]